MKKLALSVAMAACLIGSANAGEVGPPAGTNSASFTQSSNACWSVDLSYRADKCQESAANFVNALNNCSLASIPHCYAAGCAAYSNGNNVVYNGQTSTADLAKIAAACPAVVAGAVPGAAPYAGGASVPGSSPTGAPVGPVRMGGMG